MWRKTLLVSTLVCVLGLAASTHAGLDASLIGWWPLDEGSGTVAHDYSGQGNDGTLISNGPQWVPGKINGALNFDGDNDQVTLKSILAVGSSSNTVCAWVKVPLPGAGGLTSSERVGIVLGNYPDTPNTNWEIHTSGRMRLYWKGAEIDRYGTTDLRDNTWHHLAWVRDKSTNANYMYIDGRVEATITALGSDITFLTTHKIGGDNRADPPNFHGLIDDVQVYSRALSLEEIKKAMKGLSDQTASTPSPTNGARDVSRDVVLSWRAAKSAGSHDVYLGTTFSDVNDASRTSPRGVLVSQNQTATTYDAAGVFDFGRTYYWRIDEVNASPNATVFEGEVWSFTVEPLAYALPGKVIVATASGSNSAGEGPQNTVNGAGLDANDLHGVDVTTMWLSPAGSPQATWIKYEFDKVYKLQQLLVWNHNSGLEGAVGFGLKEVVIETSTDGAKWTPVGSTHILARATGTVDYASNTVIDMAGVTAKYVRLTPVSNWGGVLQQYGLSEVRFLYLPTYAREPQPSVAQTDLNPAVVLSWRSGREAVSHKVYLSMNKQAVASGTALIDTTAAGRLDVGSLLLASTYYWKVNEVNEAASPKLWEGDIWSFTTKDSVVVDDFESYNDEEGKGTRIYETWIDGYADGSSGSTVGHTEAPFAERRIVQGGLQSMPLAYNNTDKPWYSEAQRTFTAPQDWATIGADTLLLSFRGSPGAFFELPSGSILMGAAGADIWDKADECRFAYKSLSGNGSIITRVESLTNTNAWAKSGVMIRAALDPGAAFAAVYITPGNGCHFQARTASNVAAVGDTDVTTPAQTALRAPYWIKLERTGNSFSGFYSADGVTWTAMAWNPQTIPMTGNVYVGLALTSHSAGVLAGTEFSGVKTTGAVTGAWQVATLGPEQPAGNAPDTVYVALKDGAGKIKAVAHPSGKAATWAADWTQWRVSLSEFSAAGVRLDKVSAISIGIGDRSNPAKGGTGLIFIDNVLVGRFSPAAQEQSLVAWWTFDEGSGTIAHDYSGQGNDGTFSGAPLWTPGKVNGALSFDGDDDQLGLTSVLTVGASSNTVCAWVKIPLSGAGGLTASERIGILLGNYPDVPNTNWELSTNGRMRTYWNGGQINQYGTTDLRDNNWHHLAWVRDKAANANYMYIDGRVETTIASLGSDITFKTTHKIGGDNRPDPPNFHGLMDEVQVYSRALSQDEIKAIMKGPSGPGK